MRDEMAVVRDRLRELATLFTDGLIDRDQLRTGTEHGRRQLADLERELAAARATDVRAALISAGGRDEAWQRSNSLSLVQRRAAIAQTMQIVINRGRVGRPPAGAPFDPATIDVRWLTGREQH